jgi:[acyl-carrier-protein] S-malonyltransferase
MKVAFLFPGQGAQYAGMGRDLYEGYDEVRRAFEEASEAAGRDIWALCRDDDGSHLARTSAVQPAMVALESAISSLLTGRFGIKPAETAGLSLGEYAALYCSGALAFAEAVRLTDFRGRLMEECAGRHPGAMAAVLGLDRAGVEEACALARESGAEAWPCNYNCPGQIVISGTEAGVGEAAKRAQALGARRVLPLNVSGAFHTPLMRQAADAFRPALAKAGFHDPAISVYSNATARPHGSDVREMMARQIVSPVLWEDTLRAMAEAGVGSFVEIGPGKTLAGFVKKTLEGASVLNVEDAASLEKTLEQLK